MITKLLILAAIGVAISSVAQSPPPPPTPTKTAQEKQNEGNAEDRQSENTNSQTKTSSATVNQASPAPTQSNAGSNGAPNRDKPTTKWNWNAINTAIVTIFTIVLAAVGVFQWLSMKAQADYMRRGLRVSINAAKSARFSAIAAQGAVRLGERNTAITERAVVVLESIEATRLGEVYPITGTSVVIFTLRNFGETVARAVKLKGDLITTLGNGFLRDTPEVTIAPQGANQWITCSLRAKIEEKYDYVIANMNKEEGALRYKIDVTYSDVFGDHWHKAEGHYVPLLKKFINTSSSSD